MSMSLQERSVDSGSVLVFVSVVHSKGRRATVRG